MKSLGKFLTATITIKVLGIKSCFEYLVSVSSFRILCPPSCKCEAWYLLVLNALLFLTLDEPAWMERSGPGNDLARFLVLELLMSLTLKVTFILTFHHIALSSSHLFYYKRKLT